MKSSKQVPPGRDSQGHPRQLVTDSEHLQVLLHQREEDNTDFFATLAHELRNPLAPIRSALHVLRVAESDHAMTSAACAMIERQLAQLIRLIDDLADVAHAAHGKLGLRRERVQLAALIREATEANRALLESKQLHLSLDLPPEQIWLYVDGQRLVQVFANILNNSAKYSDLHGEIHIKAVLDEDCLTVSIRDRGVVDDNRDGAQGLALMLDLEGHEIRTANNGLEALQIAESFRPQVVLLDIGMPGMDGYETARRLRARPWARSTLLCAQTGWGQEADRRKARDAGFDQYFVKPLDPQVLSELLATLSGFHYTGGTGAQVNG